MAGTTTSGRRDQRGIAMVLVTILGTVMLVAWSIAWRGTADTIRTERVLNLRDARNGGVSAALVEAVDNLRNGEPPSDPYQCIVTVVDGRPVRCKVVFTGVSTLVWDVDVTKATTDEIATLPTMPAF